MPRARNIKPRIFTNDKLAEITPLGRLLFIGLWTLADREGRIEYRPKRIKAEVLPYDECDIQELVCNLESRNFVRTYEVENEQYIQVVNFVKHQNPHPNEKASELPPPPHVIIYHEMSRQNREDSQSDRADSLNPDSGSLNPETTTAPRSNGDATPATGPPVITLPLNDHSEHEVARADVEHWQQLYPAVDVEQQLRNMRGWLDGNPTKRKTQRGIKRFIANWLSREQDRGGSQNGRAGSQNQSSTGKIGRAMAALNDGGKSS